MALPDIDSLNLEDGPGMVNIYTFTIARIVKSMVYDDDKGVSNIDMCETLSNFCANSKGACAEDTVFKQALFAFGVNSEAKKKWLYTVWDFMKAKPISESDKPTDKMLLEFVCEIVYQTKTLVDKSAAEFLNLHFGTPTDDEEEAFKMAYKARSNLWNTHVDRKAIFTLGTIGSDSFDRIEFVLLLRKLMCNVAEHDAPKDVESLNIFDGRPFPLVQRGDHLWLRCFINLAWIMGDLHKEGTDIEKIMFPINPTWEYQLDQPRDWETHFNSWNGAYWMNEYARLLVSSYNTESETPQPEFHPMDMNTRIVHELFPTCSLLDYTLYTYLLEMAADVLAKFKKIS